MTSIEEVATRVRAIRIAKGLTLRDVEIASNYRIRAVVLGSYERGDRSLSVRTAILIAEFYGVPLTYLLEAPEVRLTPSIAPVLDLRRFRTIATRSELGSAELSMMKILGSFTGEIIKRRNDWNGELLSLRESDFTLLSAAIGIDHVQLTQTLNSHGLLIALK